MTQMLQQKKAGPDPEIDSPVSSSSYATESISSKSTERDLSVSINKNSTERDLSVSINKNSTESDLSDLIAHPGGVVGASEQGRATSRFLFIFLLFLLIEAQPKNAIIDPNPPICKRLPSPAKIFLL
jgi:hypothetical protein